MRGTVCLEAAAWEAEGEQTREGGSRKPCPMAWLGDTNPGVAALPSQALVQSPESHEHLQISSLWASPHSPGEPR